MNKLVLLLGLLLLSGCGVKYPHTANLNIEVTGQPETVYTDAFASIKGRDGRDQPEVIVYQLKNEPVVRVSSPTPPINIITEELKNGLRSQGIKIDRDGPVRIDLELNQLLVTVTKPKRLYNAEAVSKMTLNARYGKNSITKEYIRQNSEESVRLPKVDQLESMLNGQLSDLVTTILADKNVRELIIQK